MVIVVAMTGIASFTVPSFSTVISLRILRFPLMFLAALSGMFGLSVGMFLIIFHLCSLRSCGVLFLDPLGSKEWKYILKKVFLLPVKYRNASKHAVVLVDSPKSQSDYFPRKEWD